MATDQDLERGHGALADGRWEEALSAYQAVLENVESPDALEGMGEALWWLGKSEESVRHRERAFVAFRRSGDAVRACRTGVDLSISYLINLGNVAASRGWLRRAARTVEDMDPNPMAGWLWLITAFVVGGDDSHRLLEQALRFARQDHDTDLELLALSDLGLLAVTGGQVEEGLAALDEAMAATVAGEYRRPSTVVFTTCNMLAACSMVGDLERVTEWCRAADEFMDRYGSPFMYATCRAHFGGVLVDRGRWDEGEKELWSALGMSEGAGPGAYVEAMARLGDLRLRQGRLGEAEAFLEACQASGEAALSAAALHLARGQADQAAALLKRRLQQLGEAHIGTSATLAMLVEAHLASGDVEAAEGARSRLERSATSEGRARPLALACLAAAHVAVARGDREVAVEALEECLHRFSELQLPLESARVRLELAENLAGAEPAVAGAEAERALVAFESVGASADAGRAAQLLRSLGVAGRPGPRRAGGLTRREEEVLGLLEEGLTNREIANRLFISRKTAAHHVSNVLAKLGLRNRAEAAAYAARTRAGREDLGGTRGRSMR